VHRKIVERWHSIPRLVSTAGSSFQTCQVYPPVSNVAAPQAALKLRFRHKYWNGRLDEILPLGKKVNRLSHQLHPTGDAEFRQQCGDVKLHCPDGYVHLFRNLFI